MTATSVALLVVAAAALIAGGLWQRHEHAEARERADARYVRNLGLQAFALPGEYSLHVTFGIPAGGGPPKQVRVLGLRLDAPGSGPVRAVVTDVTRGARRPGVLLRDVPAFDLPPAGASMDVYFTDPALCSRAVPAAGAPLVVSVRLPSGRRGDVSVPVRPGGARQGSLWEAALQSSSCRSGLVRPGG
jgi:hypothetical protein